MTLETPPSIYIAGPYSAADRAGVAANIHKAVAVGLEVARAGGMPVIPHANTADECFERVQPYDFWIRGTARLLTRCDGLVCVEGWETSKGAVGEHKIAKARGIPIFDYALSGDLVHPAGIVRALKGWIVALGALADAEEALRGAD